MRFLEMITAILAFIARLCEVNGELNKKLAELRQRRPRSETLERLARQLLLPFGTIPSSAQGAGAQARPKTDKHKFPRDRKGIHPRRAPLPAHLERIPVPNPVPLAMRRCPRCGIEMTTVGHSSCEILSVIPARVVVNVRLDERVACPNDHRIVTAPTPPAIVERGKLDDPLIVEATCDKYLEHAPIEHQTRAPGLLATDATGIPILDPDATDGIRSGAMLCWTNARWVTFFYSPSADSQSARRFLGEDLARAVQCDGTSVTSFLEKAGGKRPGCWSHGRRRLVEAARSGDAIALEGVRLISPLFAIERESTLAGDTAEQRRARPDQKTRPVLEELRRWLDHQREVILPRPRAAVGSAISIDNGIASSFSSTTATSRRPTIAASASSGGSSWADATGSLHLARRRRRAHRGGALDHRDLHRARRQPARLSASRHPPHCQWLAADQAPRAAPRSDLDRSPSALRRGARRAARDRFSLLTAD